MRNAATFTSSPASTNRNPFKAVILLRPAGSPLIRFAIIVARLALRFLPPKHSRRKRLSGRHTDRLAAVFTRDTSSGRLVADPVSRSTFGTLDCDGHSDSFEKEP